MSNITPISNFRFKVETSIGTFIITPRVEVSKDYYTNYNTVTGASEKQDKIEYDINFNSMFVKVNGKTYDNMWGNFSLVKENWYFHSRTYGVEFTEKARNKVTEVFITEVWPYLESINVWGKCILNNHVYAHNKKVEAVSDAKKKLEEAEKELAESYVSGGEILESSLLMQGKV